MSTATWNPQDLAEIDRHEELDVAPCRADGSLATPRIVWVVRVGDAVYVRSLRGTDGAWYRTTRARHEGHVSSGMVDQDVKFVDIDAKDDLEDRIDAAYRAKYLRYPGPVASVTTPKARATTMRVEPR